MSIRGWSSEEWDDYEDYFESLSFQEQQNELKFLESLGKSKANGKNIVVNNSNYEM